MEAPRFASGLYVGTVMHHRVKPVRHRLSYRVFSLLADLDELPRLDRELRLFAHNRFGLIGFRDRDFGPLGGVEPLPTENGSPLPPGERVRVRGTHSEDLQESRTPRFHGILPMHPPHPDPLPGGERESWGLKAWAEDQLAAAGIEGGGPIRLLCFPRVLGFVFNPLCVWFCHRRDGTLAAIIHEVSNTFGQRHAYLIPAAPGPDGLVRQSCDKRFYVSPFMDMETAYHFRIRPPMGDAGESMAVSIRQTDAGGPVLHASLTLRRVELTDGAILRAWARHPLMTAKVVAGIHWEALHLWRKGLAIRPRPPAPAQPVTVVKDIVVADRFREGHS
ncbi:hypothetical protein TSH7_24665 [Azospirillum sp. TSH7]|uniref:DUF1365 domain-containing protein n=1 Tax=unclassified Azospirillum TaxID=2630922 RepID=UPI000D60C00D|nr:MULTISPECIES: DUF1365 domain-containing protein [unclassified Azospirillum]PWC58040.1 hypothetical protein TSH7_24665 [Azospirillum sp. TSH7]PWC63215.1 hypothetical protein TSH20_20285 [Azospirillum sp. TSH20]